MKEETGEPEDGGDEVVVEKIPQRAEKSWLVQFRKLPLAMRRPAAGVVWWDLSNGMEGHPQILALVGTRGPMWPRPEKEKLAASLVRLGYPVAAAQRRLKSLDSIWAATAAGEGAAIYKDEGNSEDESTKEA